MRSNYKSQATRSWSHWLLSSLKSVPATLGTKTRQLCGYLSQASVPSNMLFRTVSAYASQISAARGCIDCKGNALKLDRWYILATFFCRACGFNEIKLSTKTHDVDVRKEF